MSPKKPLTAALRAKSHHSPSKDSLLQWFKDQKIEYDSRMMKIHCSPTSEFHVTTNSEAIPTNTIIGTVPKTACLSARNSGISNLIEEAGFTGTLALSIALLFERSQLHQGNGTPWSSYIASLPTHAQTPLFWDAESTKLLSPTDLTIEEDKSCLDSDFDEHVFPFIESHPIVFPRRSAGVWREEFMECITIVTSRAFLVDAFHGEALVPFADLFNHKSGAETIHINSGGDVCEDCGAVEGTCGCLDSDDEMSDPHHEHDPNGGCCGEDSDGMETDSETEDVDWLYHLDEAVPELVGGKAKPAKSSPRKRNSDEPASEDSLKITMIHSVKPNTEIFNTYGNHSNSKLLNLYGFAEINNPNNNVQVNLEHLCATVMNIFGSNVLMERCRFWNQVGQKAVDYIIHNKKDSQIEEEINWGDDGGEDSAVDQFIQQPPDLFNFSNNGKASTHLLAFLQIAFLNSKAFQVFTKSEYAVLKYIQHIVENELLSWSATPADGTIKSSESVNSTLRPDIRHIITVLRSLALHRVSRYESVHIEQELTELQEAIATKNYSPKRWALIVRTEEQRILNEALKRYCV
ncbi:hypothetical protein HDU79_010864 [Rhizoclosmatium sp. JEL0117]|nr:hypothetical protein HDU79_010864 [Rhizoclosmatium sp. JEL0117]